MNKTFKTKILPGNNGNAYSGSKYLYSELKVKDDNTILSSYKCAADKEKGGLIVIPVDAQVINLNDILKECSNVEKYNIGRYFNSEYIAKDGTIFNKNSLCIEVLEVDLNVLFSLAYNLFNSLKESLKISEDNNTVIIKNYLDGNIVLLSFEE